MTQHQSESSIRPPIGPWPTLPSPMGYGHLVRFRRWLREGAGFREELREPVDHFKEEFFVDERDHLHALRAWEESATGAPVERRPLTLLIAPNPVELHHDANEFPSGYTLIMPVQLATRSHLRILRRSPRDAEPEGAFRPFWEREAEEGGRADDPVNYSADNQEWQRYLIAEVPLFEGHWYLFSQQHWHEVRTEQNHQSDQDHPIDRPSAYIVHQVREDIDPELFA